MTDHELLELIAQKVTKIDGVITEMKDDIKEIKEKQARMESKIDLIYNHTGQLTEDVTMIKKDIGPVIEVEKSLLEMYGEHEAEIRALRRRPV